MLTHPGLLGIKEEGPVKVAYVLHGFCNAELDDSFLFLRDKQQWYFLLPSLCFSSWTPQHFFLLPFLISKHLKKVILSSPISPEENINSPNKGWLQNKHALTNILFPDVHLPLLQSKLYYEMLCREKTGNVLSCSANDTGYLTSVGPCNQSPTLVKCFLCELLQ